MEVTALHKEKTERLFTYLKELSLLRSPLIRDLQQYENNIFLNEIPNEPDCLSPLTSKIKDTWIEIKKPSKPQFPLPPKAIIDWLNPSFQEENIKTEPKLQDKIQNKEYKENENEEETSKYIYLIDHQEIQSNFDSYLKDKWSIWKNEFIRYEKTQDIYTKLFSIYQKQKKLGEQYELIIGIGLLNWKTPNGQLVHRHVLTAQCLFQFDSNNGIIRVIPSSDGIKAEIEQDMLELEDRLDNRALSSVKEIEDELQSGLWNKYLLDSLFRSFVFSLSANGTYLDLVYENKKESSKEPNISFSPALILRKRMEKGFQQACSTIIESLNNNTMDIPQGILRIFEELDDYYEQNELIQEKQNIVSENDQTIFFPLDANDEQRKIITNLETRNGVLVQGPPGTGKSHTIANLTSHLLSTGKRVLITSQTPRALRVLKNKIPKELQALCVSLLGGDSQSIKDLENVVQVISNRRDSWDKEKKRTEINLLTKKLQEFREKQAELKLRLRSLREKETFEHQFLNGAYKGTAQKIAKKLADERPKYRWLMDSVQMDTDNPISNIEASELIELLNELNENIQEQIQLSLPAPDLLISDIDFKKMVNREQELVTAISPFKELSVEQFESYSNLSMDRRSRLLMLLKELSQLLQNVSAKNDSWLSAAFDDLMIGKFTTWEEFFNQINVYLQDVQELAGKHNLAEVSGYGQTNITQLYSDAKLLRAHFESGKGLGMPLLRPKIVKDAWYIVKDVRIDGRKCDSLDALILLEEAVSIDRTLNMVEQMIGEQLQHEISTVNSRSLRVANIKNITQPFDLLFSVKQTVDNIHKEFQDIPSIVQNVFDEQTIATLHNHLAYVALREELEALQEELFKMEENIKKVIDPQKVHSTVNVLINSIKERDAETFALARNTILELDVYSKKNIRCEELLNKVRKTLPKLYSSLLNNFDYLCWNKRFRDWEKTFNWAKINTWYTNFSSTSEVAVKKELDELESFIKNLIAKLGAQKAWYSTLDTMTEGQRQHLLAWTTSMRKVGKGTGKNAYIHLQDAQKHMSECRDAIPAWIMPLYRVFETFEVKPGLFDVVIIDEASQSGPDAVILQYIAKKLIVVGDDKQISPEYVGIKREDIQYLRKQYLYDFKLADLLDIENSFFDLANVLFGGRITLREHFRCMPEIIQFSNRISYSNTPLIPLRQYPPNRLEPIMTKHVATGYREGSGSKVYNRPEAEAVVAEMKACIANPLYEGKSMGVISLLNEGQADLIQKRLVEEIGPVEIEKRHIICGDAYAFQGDERDVMFISLVAAPGETVMKALTSEKDRRRFNVAVSRAKDQLWLFHTPTMNDFRNKECLRYQLISYCENPEREILESNRDLCESDFEKSVFDQITSRGYRVIPQVEVAGYRIDLVIEGSKGRIAVECDGDQWHGPDRFDYDMNRQRILERCGWRFWRVRGSDYYFNPEHALSSLWETLNYYGIEPGGFDINLQESDRTGLSNFKENVTSIMKDANRESLERNEAGQTINHSIPEEIFTAFHEAAVGMEQIKTDTVVSSTEKIQSEIPESNSCPKKTLSPNDGLKEYLIEKGYEIVDKRDAGGAFWLIGGEELSTLIEELRKHQIPFTYAYHGSKFTNKRPAWFTTYLE